MPSAATVTLIMALSLGSVAIVAVRDGHEAIAAVTREAVSA